MGQSGHADAVRVVLVGRTGLDQSLRGSREVELLRARTTLEAIGELASPIDEESPSRSVVVVGEGVRAEGGEEAEFVRAAREVDPGTVVVRVGARGTEPGAYDAVVESAADVLDLGRTFGRPFGSEAGETEDACAGSGVESLISSILRQDAQRGAAEENGHGPARCGPAAGDRHVVEAMVRGEDVVTAALDVLRVRLGTPDVRFVERGENAEPRPGAEPVAWGEAVFGTLEADGHAVDALREHAAWLAGWIRLRDQQMELRNAAFTDPLTGAWNRRYFDRFLNAAIEQCRVHRRNLTLMVFDIDDFKVYNDTYGHAAGDEILMETVRLMRSVIRPTDKVCRIGGDEFGVIFYEPEGPRETNSRHPDSVYKIAQRFQEQIGRHRFPKLGSEAPGTLTVSGGLATYPWDGTTAEQLLARADELALESKRAGKNVLMMGPRAIRRGSE